MPIVQTNMGLSYARNAGAAAATGEVFAYTDSDCMADPDWLFYLIGTLTVRGLLRESAGRNLAAGGELGAGGGGGGAGRAEPCAAIGRGGGAHPGLQHGVPPMGVRDHRADSIRSTGRREMTWIFAGACRPAGR